jgi:hypothetical protein
MSNEDVKYITQIQVKSPDIWGRLIQFFGLPRTKSRKYFEFDEYASLELHVKEDMTFTGRFLPVSK